MTKTEARTTTLTQAAARRLTGRIRDTLALADDLLAEAYKGRAWEALGYGDFKAYCEGELPELRHIKLRTSERRERAAKLLAEDASEREIAAACGASVGTAHNDVAFLTGRSKMSAPVTEFVPIELPPEIIEDATRWQTVVRHVTKAGANGLTCRELEGALGWGHGMASPAFLAAEKKGYVRRSSDFREFRFGYAPYRMVSA